MLSTRYKVFVAEIASTLLLTTVTMVVTVPLTIALEQALRHVPGAVLVAIIAPTRRPTAGRRRR